MIFGCTCYTRKMANWNLLDFSILQQDQCRKKTMHTRKERNTFGIGCMQNLQRTTGILHTVIGHHSSETIGNLRLQILEKRIFTIGADSHHQLIISNIFQQQIEIFGSSLKVGIHIPYIYRLCIVDTCFHSST